MAKKIIILNGSPRPRGNTAGLVNAFAESAEGAGNTVDVFFLAGMNIKRCIGCYGGGRDPGSPCIQKDDMDLIYPAYSEADIFVLASPLYYWSITGLLKTAFDRLFAVEECGKVVKKECILLMAADGDSFDEVVLYYNALVKRMGWNSLGTVLAGGVRDLGDIESKQELEFAQILGASIK
jgi:NAD(P)H-dependent FMN reductase